MIGKIIDIWRTIDEFNNTTYKVAVEFDFVPKLCLGDCDIKQNGGRLKWENSEKK